MWLVAGLGNPGAKYARNRHNVGFMAIDALAEKLSASRWSSKFNGKVCEAHCAGEKLTLLKPETYMNLSGESVAACARFYKISPENIILLYDELDLPDGKLRVKQGGSNGGHNGVRSIDAHLGENTWRVRIGIGHPGDKNLVSHYVLSDFSREESAVQQRVIDAIAQHFSLMIAGDAAEFMNKIALATRD